MMENPAIIASNRFGMGAKPGDLEKIKLDARGWLESQLSTAPHIPAPLKDMKGTPDLAKEFVRFQKIKKQAQKTNDRSALKKNQQKLKNNFHNEIYARTVAALTSDFPLHERLLRFWANHFTVSATKNSARLLIGAFEREAIRPYILGYFEDMLIRAAAHPAMLLYLDNVQSIGPNSKGGRIRKKGLNENLAREILELHTLGVDGGYTQSDVSSFAKVLTGWTIAPPRRMPERAGQFLYVERLHEPGSQPVLGRKYSERGFKQGIAVLRDLARHPSTARFIATKLARHFISDNPPEIAINILSQEYLNTKGHLGKVMRKLISLPEAWQAYPGNIKTSEEFIISTLRGLNVTKISPKQLVQSFYELGQRVFEAPSPAGWPHEDQHWAGPDMIMKRIEWAQLVAERNRLTMPPLDLATDLLGESISPQTRTAIMRADSARQALTLLLASPEFQRR